MLRAIIKNEIEKHVPHGVDFAVDFSDEPDHGDYASNVALISAKQMKRPPREVAEDLINKLTGPLSKYVEKIEVAGQGFLNFYISHKALYAAIGAISFRKKLSFSPRRKINIEFVSANPTGPLTMANGRGGFCGDVLANILERAGHRVTREYYIKDAGNQIKLLGESILASEGKIPDREELYKGEYIKELKGKTAKQAVTVLLKNIKKSLKSAGIKFDVWFSEEQNLHKKKELKKTLEFLLKKKIL